MSNVEEKKVIYSNDTYRVEKIGLETEPAVVFIYGVYHNTYDVLEVETNILAKALNSADELDAAVSTFFQGKAFLGNDAFGDAEDSVIATS